MSARHAAPCIPAGRQWVWPAAGAGGGRVSAGSGGQTHQHANPPSFCPSPQNARRYQEKLNRIKQLRSLRDTYIKKIKEIKDNNQFIIPQAIRDKFPTLYTTNVFTEVKKIENKETMIKHKMNLLRIKVVGEGEKAAVEKERDDLLEKYMKLRDEYMKLDKAFNKEIQREIDNRRGCWRKKIVEEVEDGV